jgi:choline-sulfatase
VPLLVHAPERFSAQRVPGAVSLLDLMPTLVDLAGAAAALEDADLLDGESLLPVLNGDAPAPGRALGEYLAEGTTSPCVMVRRGPLKYIRCPGDPDLLYDLEADPGERRSLADHPGLAALQAEATARWDLEALRQDVVASQRRRRLVARALARGHQTHWDWPPPAGRPGPFIATGSDFWKTLDAGRQS